MSGSNRNPKLQSDGLETTRLKLANGWSGRIALSDSAGNNFSPEDWVRCLAEPILLCKDGDEIIKSDAGTIVAVKKLRISDKNLIVVVKCQHTGPGFKNLCRSFLRPRAIRNFDTAIRLRRDNIPAAYPLAALRQRKSVFTARSVYITEYIQNSANLHAFLRDNLSLLNSPRLALKKNLCSQVAHIFASLDNASLWHRDAKAGNFLVHQVQKDQYKITLVDMDGIKPYALRRRRLRFRCLAKLAATLFWHRSVNMTDYLRTFTIYGSLTGLNASKRRRIFRALARRAVAIRLLTLAKAGMEDAGTKTE